MNSVAQRKLDASGDLAANDACAGCPFRIGDGERVTPLRLPPRHRVEYGDHDRKFDRARGPGRFGLADADGCASIEILGVERRLCP